MNSALESLLILLGLVVVAVPIISIISAGVAHRRIRSLQDRMDSQNYEIERIQRKLSDLAKPPAESASPKEQTQPATPAAPPVVVPEPRKEHIPTLTPVTRQESRPVKSLDGIVLNEGVLPKPPADAKKETVESKAPPVASPPPPADVPPRPPSAEQPLVPAFDWEALLGVRGAALVAAVAFIIAGVLFAKYSFEQGWITPPMRIAVILLSGVGALLGSEFGLRKGYAVTANAMCGAGVAVLYAGFFSAHSVYQLIPIYPTFALMALVTLVGCLLSLRHDTVYIAVLGLLGGFATPLVLTTGRDNTVGLFTYILLLDIGLLWIAVRKNWNILALLSLGGTLLIEVMWFGRYMSPEKMWIGLVVFALFAVLYLVLPSVAKTSEKTMLLRGAALGGLAPFFFAFYLAGSAKYAAQWPLLFGFVALLNIAFLVVALRRSQAYLLASGAVATFITVVLWESDNLSRAVLWGASLSALGLFLLPNLATRLAKRFAPEIDEKEINVLETAGIIGGVGLAVYAGILAGFGDQSLTATGMGVSTSTGRITITNRTLGEPPWVFLCLLIGLTAIIWERGRREWLPFGVALVGPAVAALLVQFWFFETTVGETLLRNLSLPLLVALTWSLVAAQRQANPSASIETASNASEGGAVAATVIALGGLFHCLHTNELGRDPWPLFAALAFLLVLLVTSALRRDWSQLLVVGVCAAAGLCTAWHVKHFYTTDFALVMPIYAVFYLAFLVLPFVVPKTFAPTWPQRLWPWIASSLAGPLFFYVMYRGWVKVWGKDFIGVLPVVMAALSVVALAGVKHRFVPDPDPERARSRLRNLALFAAVALGFVSVAIPLQLDRQWITIGWALEAAAVWWLYRKLPHIGLKYFGAALYLAVGARLLLNGEVLRYYERGMPILNWILYTYGVAAACCLVGAAFLKPVEAERLREEEKPFFGEGKASLAALAALLGLVLIFALINLEIADYFSAGRYIEFKWEHHYARDLTTSIAWGLYGLGLLMIGMWRKIKPLRYVSLGILILTVGKVFLYDLSSLKGLYRVLSFLGLALSLVVVSVLYQRFVFRKEPAQ